MGLYKLEFSDRAKKALEEINKQEHRQAVDGALAQLEMDPKDLKFWTSKRDASGMYIFAGPKNYWKITFGILESAHIVYIHSIGPRPSYGFDPRGKD